MGKKSEELVPATTPIASSDKKRSDVSQTRMITPKPEFYTFFSQKQILDIIISLDNNHEIPRQYNYFKEGAKSWDDFSKMQLNEAGSALRNSVESLNDNSQAIDKLIGDRGQVNIIDLGPGNGLPVKGLLKRLSDKGVLGRYVAIDISQEMLDIEQSNIKYWFGNKIKFEGHVRDFAKERFDDLLTSNALSGDSADTINLVLFLGGTLSNFLHPLEALKNIYASLSVNDLLIYETKPDTPQNRQYLGLNTSLNEYGLSSKYSFMVELLNIDGSFFSVEMGYADRKRYTQLRLKEALIIRFKLGDIYREIVFKKGDAIVLLRAWHRSTLEIFEAFEKAGFKLLQSSLTKDRQYLLTISVIETQSEASS